VRLRRDPRFEATLQKPFELVLEARERFEQESRSLRPDLHRFCTRMTGSVSDGEDAVQDALVHAFYHLPELRQGTSLRSWLFRIAHNRCIDLLRRRKALAPLDEEQAGSEDPIASLEDSQLAQRALAVIFTQLPPRERAAIVLADVLGHPLEEVAEITGSSVGAVKAAIHRGRQKLQGAGALRVRPPGGEAEPGLELYLERFNRRDWAGVRELLAPDARLEVVGRTSGPFEGAPYFQNYANLGWEWRLGQASVEGAVMVVHFQKVGDEWRPRSVVGVEFRDGAVVLVRDYVHSETMLSDARLEPLT
jgi:RNA polymerase sigma-70 factor (ECF subfamily)